MTTEVANIEAIAKLYNEAGASGQRVAFLQCDASLQQAEVENLERVEAAIREAKLQARATQDERGANLLLGLQVLTRAIADELRMWVALKEQRPHDAWAALVSAQEHADLAVRIPDTASSGTGYRSRLEVLDHTLFPVLQFTSTGLTHAGGTCSICGTSFRSCRHVEGRIYFGQVCAEVALQNVSVDHGALVDAPRDKRCYVSEYTDGDMWYDVMTRLPTGPVEPDGQGDGHRFKCIMLTTNAIPGVTL